VAAVYLGNMRWWAARADETLRSGASGDSPVKGMLAKNLKVPMLLDVRGAKTPRPAPVQFPDFTF
jgi:hypothetical protein